MCLGSRYPYAIPLKRIDAESVAEALMEVISHTGIPVELLSDCGSVFLGKKGGLYHIFRKFDFFFLPVITFFLFLLCK